MYRIIFLGYAKSVNDMIDFQEAMRLFFKKNLNYIHSWLLGRLSFFASGDIGLCCLDGALLLLSVDGRSGRTVGKIKIFGNRTRLYLYKHKILLIGNDQIDLVVRLMNVLF